MMEIIVEMHSLGFLPGNSAHPSNEQASHDDYCYIPGEVEDAVS